MEVGGGKELMRYCQWLLYITDGTAKCFDNSLHQRKLYT